MLLSSGDVGVRKRAFVMKPWFVLNSPDQDLVLIRSRRWQRVYTSRTGDLMLTNCWQKDYQREVTHELAAYLFTSAGWTFTTRWKITWVRSSALALQLSATMSAKAARTAAKFGVWRVKSQLRLNRSLFFSLLLFVTASNIDKGL